MRLIRILIISSIFSVIASGQPLITPTDFLNTKEPTRMCGGYVATEFGPDAMLAVQPSGGAVVRVDLGDTIRCLYIFCDQPFNRLIVFSLNDVGGTRTPNGIKAYGRAIVPNYFQFEGDPPFISPPFQRFDSTGFLLGPVDIVVSSKHGFYDPNVDLIFVLDQGNQRVVKLRYDQALDSLIWVGSFGSDILNLPTAIAYAKYDDSFIDNDDIYVADGTLSRVFRFSRDGVLEASYGGRGSSYGSIGYATGIAVSVSDSVPNRFYLTDSRNMRVMRYYSATNGPIMAESWYVFPSDAQRFVKAVDTDLDGNVYVIDNFTHYITVFNANLNVIRTIYGGFGYEPGLFDHPYDIYIDKDEMQVCERWGEFSGIHSLMIRPGQPKPAGEELPRRFCLYQNYPNPFNSTTIINFDLPETAETRLVIYNVLGQLVAAPVDATLPAGSHSITWDGRNNSGRQVSSGVYFYVISTKEHHAVKKLLLLK